MIMLLHIQIVDYYHRELNLGAMLAKQINRSNQSMTRAIIIIDKRISAPVYRKLEESRNQKTGSFTTPPRASPPRCATRFSRC
jgi:hypothetical protein